MSADFIDPHKSDAEIQSLKEFLAPDSQGNYLTYLDRTRPMVVTYDRDSGEYMPFYASSGGGQKSFIPIGMWDPFFGIGSMVSGGGGDWINKTHDNEILHYYGNPKWQQYGNRLRDTLGLMGNKLLTASYAYDDPEYQPLLNYQRRLSRLLNRTSDKNGDLPSSGLGLFDEGSEVRRDRLHKALNLTHGPVPRKDTITGNSSQRLAENITDKVARYGGTYQELPYINSAVAEVRHDLMYGRRADPRVIVGDTWASVKPKIVKGDEMSVVKLSPQWYKMIHERYMSPRATEDRREKEYNKWQDELIKTGKVPKQYHDAIKYGLDKFMEHGIYWPLKEDKTPAGFTWDDARRRYDSSNQFV